MQNADLDQLQTEIAGAAAFTERIRAAVGQVIVGQEALVTRLLIGLLTNGHILVEGVPGLAKTLAVSVVSQTLGGQFARLQFTPDLLPADLLGTQIYNPTDHSFRVHQGPIFANFILADEINRAPAKVQSALLEAMQERQVTLAGETQPLPDPFLVMATQNPIELEGTYPLPEAQVDRFLMHVNLSYPNREEEAEILTRMGHPVVQTDVAAVASFDELQAARDMLDRIYLDEKAAGYILDLVFATRGQADQLSERQARNVLEPFAGLIAYGASPRASLSLVLAAKAYAFLQKRAYVLPADIKAMAPDVLRHRVLPSYEAEAEGLTSNDLIQRFLDALVVP